MSQPIRVEGWAYTPGARVNLRLQVRSQSTYARVKAHFHNPSGGVIKLEGVTHTREESGAAHTEVVLTGNVPQNAALGTYECRSVEGLTGERKWAPIFEDPGVQHPRGPTPLPRPKWGRVPRARASLEGGKPNPPARWPLTNSRASPVIHPKAWKVNSPKFVCSIPHKPVQINEKRDFETP